MVDLRIFSIRESHHRIHNPLTEHQLATFGAALDLPAGARVLDLACGSGELLSTWARAAPDHRAGRGPQPRLPRPRPGPRRRARRG